MLGKIIKGIGGFYYIHTAEDEIYSCRAVGIFRKLKIKPLVGDNVRFEITDTKDMEGSLTEILPRKNVLARPAVSNIDQAVVVFAVREPDLNTDLLDRFLISMDKQDIPAVIYFNKADLDKGGLLEKYTRIYEGAGYRVISGSTSNKGDMGRVREIFKDRVSVLAGPSGAGKSSLVNELNNGVCMEVGELSVKIKRGKQTTRHTELFTVDHNSYVLDTPGFASLYLNGIEKEDLGLYFNEFVPYIAKCRFPGCSHIYEDREICEIKRKVESGSIPLERYESYRKIYEELKEKR